MGGRDVDRAHRMASSRQSGSTSLAQPFSDGPFEFDGPDTLAIGERRWSIAIVTPVREPAVEVTGQPGRIGQHNLVRGPPSESAMPDGDHDHYRLIVPFGKMLRHCDFNATRLQIAPGRSEVSLTKPGLCGTRGVGRSAHRCISGLSSVSPPSPSPLRP